MSSRVSVTACNISGAQPPGAYTIYYYLVMSSSVVLAGGKVCVGMQGLIEEGIHIIEAQDRDDVRDAALIAAAQKVEHHEIAGYGTRRTWADALDYGEIADKLDECADEEGEADKRLTKIATGGFFGGGVNREAQLSG